VRDVEREVMQLLGELEPFCECESTPIVPEGEKLAPAADAKKVIDGNVEGFFKELFSAGFQDSAKLGQHIHDLREQWESGEKAVLERAERNLRTIKRLAALVSEDRPGGTEMNGNLMKLVAKRLGWPDDLDYLTEGAGMLGYLGDQLCLPVDWRAKSLPTTSLDDLKKNAATINARTIAREKRAGTPKKKMKEDLEKELEELEEAGRAHIIDLDGSSPGGEIALAEYLLSPYYGIEQGLDGEKTRAISNYSEKGGSGVNACIWPRNRIVLQTSKHLAQVLKLFRDAAGTGGWLIWKADQKSAYRQIAVCEEERKLLSLFYDGKVIVPTTMNFGCIAAVLRYVAHSVLCSFLVAALCGLPCLAYIDDFFGAAPPGENGQRAYEIMLEMHEAMGIVLKKAKCRPPSESMQLLGCVCAAGADGALNVTPCPRRVAKLTQLMEGALETGRLSAKAAGKIAGTCSFICYSTPSRVGRPYLKPLYAIQYGRGAEGGELGNEGKNALKFWRKHLRQLSTNARNAVLQRNEEVEKPHILITDASKKYGGWTLITPEGKKLAGNLEHGLDTLPIEKRLASPYLEAYSAVGALVANARRLRGNAVIFAGDNKPCVEILKRGSSAGFKNKDESQLDEAARIFLEICAQFDIFPWHQYMPGKVCIADLPSRPDERASRILKKHGFRICNFRQKEAEEAVREIWENRWKGMAES
jgi:hypothetical protein